MTTPTPGPSLVELTRLRILSDGALYDEACLFARDTRVSGLSTAQIRGLLQQSQSWKDLQLFVKHQASRTTFQGATAYQELGKYLQGLPQKVGAGGWGFVPAGLNKQPTREQTALWCGLVAREFVQHLVAEHGYQRRHHGPG